MLNEGPILDINRIFGSAEKKFSINFSKGNTKFCLRLHYNADKSYLLVNGKEIFKFKTDNKNCNFPTKFCPGSISNGFSVTESREVSLNLFRTEGKRSPYHFFCTTSTNVGINH